MPETAEDFEAGQKAVKRYKPPSKHKIKFRRRVFQVEGWIHKKGLVTKPEVLGYIMRAFDIEEKPAKEIYKAVEQDFAKIGKVYGQN